MSRPISYSVLQPKKQVKLQDFSAYKYLQEIICLATRLFMQVIRRPSGLISGLIQPLLWLLLFGGLFQNIPLSLFGRNNNYGPFLSCGIIVFTSFTASLNAGLPLIFDREFGFLNRLLATPIVSRYNIILGATFFIICITMIQNLIIMLCSFRFFNFDLDYRSVSLVLLLLLLLTSCISSISLSLSFILPGHIEFLAFSLIVNLPTLFASTALAPIYFMPYWLQIVARCNILTYAIEAVRFIVFKHTNNYASYIGQSAGNTFNLCNAIIILIIASAGSFLGSKIIISKKIE